MVARGGVDRVHLVAAAQRVDDQVLQAVRHRGGVWVDDEQHPPARGASSQCERRLETLERIGGCGGRHGGRLRLAHASIGTPLDSRSVEVWRTCGYTGLNIAVRIKRGGGTG